MEDKRFSHIKTDPKFRRIPKKERKVKIDKRFESMFKDKKFKVKYTIDKRGRPVNHTSNEDLKRYYELSSESESTDIESEIEESELKEVGKFVKPLKDEDEEGLDSKHVSDKTLTDNVKKKLRDLSVDYARGESNLFSESSSDDEDSEEELSESENIDHKWGELDAEAEHTEEATTRLAACNMDWDRIRAVDLLVLFNSFLPPGGVIKSVAIYPSEFGKARMKEEEIKGPTELVQLKSEDNENNDEDDEEGASYHMEKLRQYQLNRLKYYYAVISFDSINSANKIYTECDGMEYESSAIKLDLRFVPEDMDFDDEPKEFCDRLPEANKYQPRFFTNTALQQAKVALTWDETDPGRIEVTQKLNSGKLDELSQEELHHFLASSSGEENSDSEENEEPEEKEEGNKDVIEKYKALLQDIKNTETTKSQKDLEMEISWGIDLKEKTEKLIKEKQSEVKTPFEQYLDKKKEKRKENKKKKKEQENDESDIPSDIDMNDPYFAEEFNNAEFKKTRSKKPKQKYKSENDSEQNQGELELLLLNEENQNHFSLKKIQKGEDDTKRKKKRKNKGVEDQKTTDNFEINVNDARFSALYSSHHFNIDPSDPHFKKTKGIEALVNEKIKRRIENDNTEVSKPKQKKNAELNYLVKSVKRKTNEYMNK